VREVYLKLAAGIEPIAAVDEACERAGLTVTLRGTLAAYPGCVHWHVKKGREAGTLEITWWPKTGQLWFKIADNRNGHWIASAAGEIRRRIEA
jgi:hypothetical protein